jgi:hypothetical protein
MTGNNCHTRARVKYNAVNYLFRNNKEEKTGMKRTMELIYGMKAISHSWRSNCGAHKRWLSSG